MLTVMKFGGKLRGRFGAHPQRSKPLYRKTARRQPELLLSLSAMGKTTDNLIATAKQITEQPSRRELDIFSQPVNRFLYP